MPADEHALNSLSIERSGEVHPGGGRGRGWLIPGAITFLLAIGFGTSVRAALATDEAADYETRIEFGYLSEDANALRALARSLASLAADADGDPLLHYLAAHTAFRLAQVLNGTHKPGTEDAARSCVEHLAGFTHRGSKDVEAFAQEAACHGLLAGIGVVKAVTHGPQAADAIAVALQLAQKNPRTRLADALVDYWRPGRLGGDRARAFRKFKAAMELFEAVPAGASNFPSWGSADAYLWLGRCYVEQGDVAAARSALEKALIVAPDFAAARRQLAQLSAHH